MSRRPVLGAIVMASTLVAAVIGSAEPSEAKRVDQGFPKGGKSPATQIEPAETESLAVEPVPTGSTAPDVVFMSSFDEFVLEQRWLDGSVYGEWLSRYDGYGRTTVLAEGVGGGAALAQTPKAATRPEDTHASLVISQQTVGDLQLDVRLRTARQLRTPTPNGWEVAWVLWHYEHDHRFYYFVPKPNGWELGKVDNSKRDPGGTECIWPTYSNCRYPGAQRFLATGSNKAFPVGHWYDVRIRQVGPAITVSVDGAHLVTFQDDESPYLSGSVGLYSEDAEVRFDDVTVVRP